MNVCGINYPAYSKPGDVEVKPGKMPGKMHAVQAGTGSVPAFAGQIVVFAVILFYFSGLKYIHSLHPARSAFMRK